MQQPIRHLPSGAVNTGHRGIVRVAPVAERSSSGMPNQPQFRPSFSFDNQRNNKLNVASEMKIETFRDLLLGAALCNDAEKQLVQDAQLGHGISKMNTELRLVADAVDIALYNLCVYRCHIEINEVRCLNPSLKILPFNSSNKFMISANRLEPHDLSSLDNGCTILITMKGAPEIVIQRCASYKTNDDQILSLAAEVKEKIFNGQETLGRENNIVSKC
jgi:magnesium-transporting ATPase (P-type)